MKTSGQGGLAGIQYMGITGAGRSCRDAVIRLIQSGSRIVRARLLSRTPQHGIILTVDDFDTVAIKSGFCSEQESEGAALLGYTLQLLRSHGAEIDEYDVDLALLQRLEASALTTGDLDGLDSARPVQPTRWIRYIEAAPEERNSLGGLWRAFPTVIPLWMVDRRLADLAINFWNNPDQALTTGQRRLEDILRRRTGLGSSGSRLFHQCFDDEHPRLLWRGVGAEEAKARAELYAAAFLAHRDPKSHRVQDEAPENRLSEFLLLNYLFLLESQASDAVTAAAA